MREAEVRFLRLVASVWLVLVCVASAYAEKRVALVVGNERYRNLAAGEQLAKAVNDARAVGGALRQLGFDVVSGENLDRQALLARIDETARRLTPGDTVFFFFSGHGIAVDGFNYILPTDIPAGSGPVSLTGAAIKEEDLTAAFQRAGARVTVVVLDACRNNPFANSGTKGIGGEKGLAPHEPPSGVFSLYAASRGESALDRLYDGDRDPNSVFTRVLVPRLTRSDLDLPALAREVREEVTRVARSVNHEQRPAYYDETSGDRIFLAAVSPVTDPDPNLNLGKLLFGTAPGDSDTITPAIAVPPVSPPPPSSSTLTPVVARPRMLRTTSIPITFAGKPKELTDRLMAEIYGPYNQKHSCWLGAHGKTHYCMKPVHIETIDDKKYKRVMIAIVGAEISGDVLSECHVCQGALGLIVLAEAGSHFAVVAENGLFEKFGGFGGAGLEFAVSKLGVGDVYGWLISERVSGAGEFMTVVHVYPLVNNNIFQNGMIITGYNDKYRCSASTTNDCSDISGELSVDTSHPSGDSIFYDLILNASGTREGSAFRGSYRLTPQYSSYTGPPDIPEELKPLPNESSQ